MIETRRNRLAPVTTAVVAALLLAGAGLAPRADAASLPLEHVKMSQQRFDDAGNPVLAANLVPDDGLVPRWSTCAPGATTCTPSGTTARSFEPGPTPAGTEFVASGTRNGTTYVARSSPWQGTVAATAPPSLAGAPQLGQRVTATGAAWSGGWGGEFDHVSVVACRTAGGQGCTTIAHPQASPAPGNSVVLDARWTGRHLFAYDVRYGRDTPFPAIRHVSPTGVPVRAVGPTVARSAPLGPVTGPGTVAMRRQWTRLRDGRVLVGRATCPRGCVVSVSVANRPGGTEAQARVRFRGSRRLAVAFGGLTPHTSLIARVRLGGTPAVTASLGAPH